MIYTVGNTKDYTRYFLEQGTPKKKGKTPSFVGGSVWPTKEEAQKFCPIDFSVYGVNADWEKDTEPDITGLWNNLLIDAELVQL